MIRFVQVLITGILASLFYFPLNVYAIPGVNSKMALAVVGLACVMWELTRNRRLAISRSFLWLVFWACAVSIASLLSISINQTPDNSYVGYIASFSVWLSAAYAVCFCIRGVHGRIDAQLVLEYLAGACLFQCISAVLIDSVPAIQTWVDSVFSINQKFMHRIGRLYGLGALLDVAGTRFCVVLVGLGCFIAEIFKPLSFSKKVIYQALFLAITIIGNIIARTTLVGTVLGVAVIVFASVFRPKTSQPNNLNSSVLSWVLTLGLSVIVCIILYNTNLEARKLLRFGFEGFFSLVETGSWDVSSNDRLMWMMVFPESLHTWAIGDGYFENSRYDINYLGSATEQGYYMGTDVGYLRFIYYFGVVGLITIMGVMVQSALICIEYFRRERLMFALALVIGMIIWIKVSTDVFPFFAAFLSAAALQNDNLPTDA